MRAAKQAFFVSFLALASCGGSDAPAAIIGTITPARVWYHTDQDVTLGAVITDGVGDPIADLEVVWTVEPADAAMPGPPTTDPAQARFTLLTEGTTQFTGCVVMNGGVSGLCDTVTARVDDGMPTLEVTSPTPGSEMVGPDGILVFGSVADRSIVRVYVNGQPSEVDANGQFEAMVIPFFGVNHIVVSATDGLTDAARVEMDVLWAEGYTPALSTEGLPQVALSDGMALWLGQDFFDDEVPFDPAVTPVQTSDLADLMELVVGELDINSVIPNPVVSNSTITLRVPNASLGAPHVEIDLRDDGADLFVRIGDVRIETTGTLDFSGIVPLDGTVTASVVAFAHLTMRQATESSPLEVIMGPVTLGIESMEGDFADPDTTAAFRLLAGVLRTTLENLLVGSIDDLLQNSVPAVLQDALLAIDGALANQVIPIDAAPFPPTNLLIDGGIRNLRTVFRREMVATMRMSVGTDTPALYPTSRGVAGHGTSEVLPEFFRDGSVQLAVRLTLLNGLLHALWNSGFLNVDVTPLLPAAVSGLVSEARLLGRMAPVLRPTRPEETTDFVLSLGQLEVLATFNGEPVHYGITIDAGVNVDLIENRISIDLAETPTINVWTIQGPSDSRLLTPEILRGLLLEVWPQLRSTITEGLSLELPLPSFGDFGGLAPDLAALTLNIELTDRVRPRGDVILIDARLIGTLP